MAFAIITIPFNPATKSFHPDELNRFCLNKKILTKKVEFFKDGKSIYWSVFLEYETVLEETGKETIHPWPRKQCMIDGGYFEKQRVAGSAPDRKNLGKSGVPTQTVPPNLRAK